MFQPVAPNTGGHSTATSQSRVPVPAERPSILLVDDDPAALQSMTLLLQQNRPEWDVCQAHSGPAALEHLASKSVAVIVTDMRMPGMNGAELLTVVRKEHPQTVRIILSGNTDQKVALNCVGSIHQYLLKPCSAADLAASIKRATVVNAELENGPLKHAVAAMERLPVLPERFMEIVEALEDENRGVEDVARILAKDIGLTARLLQLVNSGFFGLRRQISDINEAVSFLGLDLIKSLVIALDTYSQYDPQELAWFGLEKLWNHGLRTGTVARKIAQLEGAARHVQEDAFVGGMLHDVGKLILAANFPDDYRRVLQLLEAGKLNGLEAELKVFGTTHATVAGYLLGLWGLPVPVVEAIALHHDPVQSDYQAFNALTAVHAANVIATREEGGKFAPAGGWKIDAEYLNQLGLSDRFPLWEQEAATDQNSA